MNLFRGIRGQEGARNLLSAAVASDRLAHAYLLAGPRGCGRFTMALDLVACLICPEEEAGFCGVCPHCMKVFSHNHPDVRITLPRTASVTPEQEAALLAARASDGMTPLVFPGNTRISIGQIREIEARLARKSFEGRGHGEIVVDAHLMGREAANALLKTLEEPPRRTLIVLTTSHLSGVLPTVRSRSHCVRLGTLHHGIIREILSERTDLEPEDAETVARASGGSPGRALLTAAQWTGPGEDRATEVLGNLTASRDEFELLQYAGKLSRELGREGLLDLCGALVSVSHRFRGALARGAGLPLDFPRTEALTDSYLEKVRTEFIRCGERLGRNVSPSMALEAAMLSLAGNGGK